MCLGFKIAFIFVKDFGWILPVCIVFPCERLQYLWGLRGKLFCGTGLVCLDPGPQARAQLETWNSWNDFRGVSSIPIHGW